MILSAKDCEIHIKHCIPYTIEKPFPEGIAHLADGYAWDYRSGQYYIKSEEPVSEEFITIYYDMTAGWSLDGSTGSLTVQVPMDATDCYVAGLLCILTGRIKYATYCENNPDDMSPVIPEEYR